MFTQDDNSNKMVNKLFVTSLPNEKQNAARKKPRAWLRQSEVFFPLAIVAHHVVPPGMAWSDLVLSSIIQIFDRVISDKVWRTSTSFCAAFFVSEEYSITHYKVKDCLDL